MAPRQITTKGKALPSHRRSPCPVACSLDIFGDKWTLLVIRDLMLGRTRFKDFAASPEGIPTNILSERLERLLAAGIIETVPAAEGARRLAYQMTKKGVALAPVIRAIKDWGLQWGKGHTYGYRAPPHKVGDASRFAFTMRSPRADKPSARAQTTRA